MVSNPVRVAVIGVGYLGRFHALIYARLNTVKLVGVVDINLERAHTVAAECQCPVFTTATELLDCVDAVSIVVPTTAHLTVARPFLERGCAVLLEKPIAATQQDALTLVTLAQRCQAILQIGHLERFNAGVLALAAHINNPRYIEAYRLGGFVERATDVDVVTDLMIHDIDIILTLVAADLVDIRALGSPVFTDHIDIANARLEFNNGVVAQVVASRVSEQALRRIRVFQPGCYLALDFIKQTLDKATPTASSDSNSLPTITKTRINSEVVKPLDQELASFIDVVRTRGQPIVDGQAGLRALEVALKIRACIHHPS
jgi:predicted dehydrogenase